jgi:hypothetical protein
VTKALHHRKESEKEGSYDYQSCRTNVGLQKVGAGEIRLHGGPSVLRAMGSVKGSAGERPNLEGVLVATDVAEVARAAVELLRGGSASLSGPPLERRRRAALRQAKPEDAAAQVVAILLARSLVAQYQRRLMCICVSTILTN